MENGNDSDKPATNLEILIQQELEMWQKEGLDPGKIGIANPWKAHQDFIALVELLEEKGIITDEEFIAATLRRTLLGLQECRKQFGEQMRRARILEGIHVKPPTELQ